MIRATIVLALCSCASQSSGPDASVHDLQADPLGRGFEVERACANNWPPVYKQGLCNGATSPNSTATVQCPNTFTFDGARGCCEQPGDNSSPVYFFECP